MATLIIALPYFLTEPSGGTAATTVLRSDSVMVWDLIFSPDGRTICTTARDRSTTSWDLRTGRTTKVSLKRAGGCAWAAFAPGADVLAAVNGDSSVTLWEIATGDRRADLSGNPSSFPTVGYSRDGSTLATADDSEIRLWDAATGRLRARFPHSLGGVHRIAWAPDGRTLALGSKDGAIWIWEIGEGLRELAPQAHSGPMVSLEFANDGQVLLSASSSDTVVRLWEVAGGRLLREFRGHSRSVQSAVFSPGGQTLATAAADSTVRLWDTSTGHALHTFPSRDGPFTSVGFSPDGRLLAGGGSGVLCVWDLERLRSDQSHARIE